MIYVALLRGINVGGKSKVEMPRLKKCFEDLGFDNVETYINSGNVIFNCPKSASEIVSEIEQAINNEFGLAVSIVLRDQDNIALLCKKIPKDWTNDKIQRTDVMFLWPEIDNADILRTFNYKPDIENVLYVDGAVVWNIGRENVTKGSGVKLIKTDIYKQMTIRNINTVLKLNELMKNISTQQ